MPAAIPFIIQAAAAYFGASALTTAALTIAASYAVASREKRKAERQARNAFNDSLQDRLTQIRSSISPAVYVLGTVRKGGTLMYAESLGAKKEVLDTVTAFARNKCDLIAYYLGDERVELAGVGSVLDSKYGRTTVEPKTESLQVTTGTGSATLELSNAPYAPAIIGYYPSALGTVVAAARQGTNNFKLTATALVGNTLTVSGLPNGVSTVTVTYNILKYTAIALAYASGDPNQAALQSTTSSLNTKWTPNHRLRGVAHMRTQFYYDETAYFSGAPAIGAVLTGGTVSDGSLTYSFFDPRTSASLAQTKNPALLAAWFMTLPRRLGGWGVPSTWIDWTTVADAANICDEMVTVKTITGAGTEQIRRYECDTVIGTDNSPVDNLDIILSAMAGRRCFTGGLYKIFAGAFRSAIVTLTDADVIGDKSITADPSGGDDSPPNVVTARFSDSSKGYVETSPRPISNPAYIAQDGAEVTLDVSLPATTDARRASYLMGVALEQARPAFTIQLSVGGIGENLGLGDTVQLNLINRSVYSGKTLEIVGYIDNWDGTFDLSLQEMKATTYALDPNTYTPINQPAAADLSYLWRVMPLTNFRADPVSLQQLRDGSVLVRVHAFWDAITDPFVLTSGKIEIRYKDAFDSSAKYVIAATARPDDNSIFIDANLVDGNVYQFEARIINGVGASSYWVVDYAKYTGNRVDTKYIARGNARATDLSFGKYGGVQAYDSDVYSIDGYNSCHLQFRKPRTDRPLWIGFSTNPSASSNEANMQVAWAFDSTAGAYIGQNGSPVFVKTYTVNTEFGLQSDGVNISLFIDRQLYLTVPKPAGLLYLDSSFFQDLATVSGVIFGPGVDFEDFAVGTRELADQAATKLSAVSISGSNQYTLATLPVAPNYYSTTSFPAGIPDASTAVNVTLTCDLSLLSTNFGGCQIQILIFKGTLNTGASQQSSQFNLFQGDVGNNVPVTIQILSSGFLAPSQPFWVQVRINCDGSSTMRVANTKILVETIMR